MKTLTVPYLPTLDALGTTEAILDRLESQGARHAIDNANWEEMYPYRPLASFTVAYTDTALYIDFFTRCNYLRAVNYQDQSPVSQDSCVEVFLQPRPGGEYWNFEFNCIGAINASHRQERPSPVRLSAGELARVRRYPSCGTKPFCEVEGLFAWNLLVVIPFDLMDVTPHAGMEMRGNFYKCASACTQPHYLSWAPIVSEKPNFHLPEFFGSLILGEK